MAKFEKGRSGNPQGRPRGAKSSVTALRKELISDEDLQAIVDVVVGKAKEGDLTAAGMILDRRLPRLKVTADFGLEKDNLAEQLKAARERVAAASRPVLQVVTGVAGGLVSGPDAPDDTDSTTPVPEPVSAAVPRDSAHAREISAGIAPAPSREESNAPPPHPLPTRPIRLGSMSTEVLGVDFDPWANS